MAVGRTRPVKRYRTFDIPLPPLGKGVGVKRETPHEVYWPGYGAGRGRATSKGKIGARHPLNGKRKVIFWE